MLSLLLHTSIYEWVAFFCSVAYVSLAAYQKKIAWIFAFISSAIYVYLCFDSRLYLDSFLQMFYVLAAVYGWITWSRTKDENRLNRKSLKFHLIFIAVIAVLAIVLGNVMQKFTNQAAPFVDAPITLFSLFATYLVAQKVVENWWYWIVIDAICIPLFYSRGLYVTSLLYVVYTIMAVVALIQWKRSYQLSI
jgi:nicotinamide mononucleotide transporter